MSSTADTLIRRIKSLEQELIIEIQNEQQEFIIKVNEKRKHSPQQEKNQIQHFSDYLKKASIKNIISTPFIWSVFIPVLLLDVVVSIYQAI